MAVASERTERAATESEKTRTSKLKQGLYDVGAGLGNGFSNAFKGFTEFVEEVGIAIGDSAIHHSKQVFGDEYCEKITSKQVEAAGNIGLGVYKVGNVASFGLAGLMIDVVVEGAVISQLLLEFLQGPVLLMGRFEMTQVPQRPQEYLAVLRPWSLAFYLTGDQFTGKPVKIVPTSMLDTLPLLRLRKDGDTDDATVGELDTVGHGFGIGTESGIELQSQPLPSAPPSEAEHSIGSQSSADVTEGLSPPNVEGVVDSDLAETLGPSALPPPPPPQPAATAAATAAAAASATLSGASIPHVPMRSSILTRIKGGKRSHIEICTVDCSVYLLYPPADDLQLWYEELKQACARVESIEKKKSGAVELALARRLRLLPRKFGVSIEVHQLIVQSEEEGATSSSSMAEGGRRRLSSGDAVSTTTAISSATGRDSDCVGAIPVADSALESMPPSDAPAPTPTVPAPSAGAPSLMRRMADSARNATLTAAKVRVTLVGRGSLRPTGEDRWLSEVPLISGGSGTSERMFASWLRTGGTLPFADSNTSANCQPKNGTNAPLINFVELGQSCCVSPEEIESILVTVRVNSVINGYGELGRVAIDLSSILCEEGDPPSEQFLSLKVRRKKSLRVVGTITLTAKTWAL